MSSTDVRNSRYQASGVDGFEIIDEEEVQS